MSDEIDTFPHLRAGDRVKLTGSFWGERYKGREVVIKGRTTASGLPKEVPYFHDDEGSMLYIYRDIDPEDDVWGDWGAELVEPKEDLRKELHDYLAAVNDGVAATMVDAETLATLGEKLGVALNDVSVRYEDEPEEEALADWELDLLYPEGEEFRNSVDSVLKLVRKTLLAKNRAYGNSALDPIRVFSKADPIEQLNVRIDDKLSRIVSGDKSEDVTLDLIGYLVIKRIAETK